MRNVATPPPPPPAGGDGGGEKVAGMLWDFVMGGGNVLVSYVWVGFVEVLVLVLTLCWLGRGSSTRNASSSSSVEKSAGEKVTGPQHHKKHTTTIGAGAGADTDVAAAAAPTTALGLGEKLFRFVTLKPYFSFRSPALEKAYLRRTVRENMKSAEYYCGVVLCVHLLILHFTVVRKEGFLYLKYPFPIRLVFGFSHPAHTLPPRKPDEKKRKRKICRPHPSCPPSNVIIVTDTAAAVGFNDATDAMDVMMRRRDDG